MSQYVLIFLMTQLLQKLFTSHKLNYKKCVTPVYIRLHNLVFRESKQKNEFLLQRDPNGVINFLTSSEALIKRLDLFVSYRTQISGARLGVYS